MTITTVSVDDPGSLQDYYFQTDLRWEFPRENLVLLDTKLGEGAFGQVYLAIANGIKEGDADMKVAVKTLKRNACFPLISKC